MDKCNFSTKMNKYVMTGKQWSAIHEPHLPKGGLFDLKPFEHPSGLWTWIICPCGAKLLSEAKVVKVKEPAPFTPLLTDKEVMTITLDGIYPKGG